MNRNDANIDDLRLDPRTAGDLVDLLEQSLADTLDLTYQTKRARWNLRGSNFSRLHPLFDRLCGQLAAYGEEFAGRVASTGGQGPGTIRFTERSSGLAEYPRDATGGWFQLDTLVDNYGEYAGRMRTAARKVGKLGDQSTARFYIAVSRDMDQALWMLTSREEP